LDYEAVSTGQENYWAIPLTGLTIQGSAVPLATPSASAVVELGFALIGGPSAIISSIFAQIPGSQPGTGNHAGYWFYPCGKEVSVALSFGAQYWSISPDDFRLAFISSNTCISSFVNFDANVGNTNTNTTAPSWLIGDTFLVRFLSFPSSESLPHVKKLKIDSTVLYRRMYFPC